MSSQQLAAIESDIAKLQKKLSRGNVLSTVIALILLSLMFAYFLYGYREINSVLNPTTITDLGQTLIDDNIPTIKKTVQSEVEKNAPVWAQSLSQQAVDSMPQIRESLVNHTVEQVDQLISENITLSEATFDEMIEKNRDQIKAAIQDVKTDEGISDVVLATLEDGLEEVLQADFKEDSQEILAYSLMMQDKMDRLFTGKDLNENEKLERQALMVLRRLQLSEIDKKKE